MACKRRIATQRSKPSPAKKAKPAVDDANTTRPRCDEGAVAVNVDAHPPPPTQSHNASRLACFLERTRGSALLPGLFSRAVAFYRTLDHPDKRAWLGSSLNTLAWKAGAPMPDPHRHTGAGASLSLSLPVPAECMEAFCPHMALASLPACEHDNPHHLIAIMASQVRGWWVGVFERCIAASLVGDGKRDRAAEIITAYLAWEEVCGGLRWHGTEGIVVERLLSLCLEGGAGVGSDDDGTRRG
jgi:hypothetical protein